MKPNLRNCLLFFLFLLTPGIHSQYLIPAPKMLHVDKQRKVRMGKVVRQLDPKADLPDEGYTLQVRPGKVVMRAKTRQGLVWAAATLRQLQDEKGLLPQVTITDYPAFAVRGFMHDTGRNFRSVERLRQEIDLFSSYKLNVFHWHLTDHPAWRIECRCYPQLNDARYQRKGRDQGAFYTYQEIRDLMTYARERGVTIIPEIDMPGHSTYFKTAFGFTMDSDSGRLVLRRCLQEFFSEIPADLCPYLHIGSDEVHVSDPKGFMSFCEDIVRQAGRTPICWNPGLPAADGTIRQVWYASEGAKLATETPAWRYLDSYMGYLNSENPVLNTSRYFLHTACSKAVGDAHALGGILCLWNDVRVADKSLTFPHNGMPNGLLAFAERFWCGGAWLPAGQESLLPAPDTSQGRALAEFERRLSYHRDHFLKAWNMRWVANAMIPWYVTLPVSDRVQQPQITVWGGVVDWLALCKEYGVEVKPQMQARMTTEIYTDSDRVIEAWVGFESPARSNRKSDGIGPQGRWEAKGRLFVNGTEVFPAVSWQEPGGYQFHFNTWARPEEELPYTNEQLFWMRTPALIKLHKGWNRVELCGSYIISGSDWFTSFMPVRTDSQGHVHEVMGLRYR